MRTSLARNIHEGWQTHGARQKRRVGAWFTAERCGKPPIHASRSERTLGDGFRKRGFAVYYDGDHMGAGGWVFMALIAVVLLGLLAAFIIWLVQDQRRRPHRDQYTVSGSASEILNRRLATGEISVQEYERLKASLATPAGPRPSPTEPPTAP